MWWKKTQTPLVILCPTDEEASKLAADINTLIKSLFLEKTTGATENTATPSSVAIHLPHWEQSLYQGVTPSIQTRLQRISALSVFSSVSSSHPNPGELPLSFVCTTMAAANLATIPSALLIKNSHCFNQGDSVGSREQFVKLFSALGYLRVETVEDPGSFAVRGEIVDLFPPTQSEPIRIELFDDTIEKIRAFNPDTQRTTSATHTRFSFGCAREVLIQPESLTKIRARIKAFADEVGIPKPKRDLIIEEIQNGAYPDHSEAWAPFFYENPETFWDHLFSKNSALGAQRDPAKQSWAIAWADPFSVEQNDELFLGRQNSEQNKRIHSELIPPPKLLYRRAPDLDAKLNSLSALFLDQIELLEEWRDDTPEGLGLSSPTPKPEKKILIKANHDLLSSQRKSFSELEPSFRLWKDRGFQVHLFASTVSQLERIQFLLKEHDLGVVFLHLGTLSEGFRWPAEKIILLTEQEFFGLKQQAQKKKRGTNPSKESKIPIAALDLQPGDAVVHTDHGVGRYQGLTKLSLSVDSATATKIEGEFLVLEYAGKDKLYLPVYRLNVLQKYIGAGDSTPLDRLGTAFFAKEKERAKASAKTLAIDLLKLYAERQMRPGVRISPPDSSFKEFEASFPFEETDDQLKAIEDSLSDLQSGRVMDRLICGDVGFGKTEVAIRAAYNVVSDGKQVVILVPTTVLAHQHERSFRSRMQNTPLVIESLSRFKSKKEQQEIVAATAKGKVDILIGTHRLLSKDVSFQDLGLVIIDEEHRFGVEHKEKLKTLRTNCHVLTLTATPIPRTLHMALSGLRDITLIQTPPVDRLPIRTYISKYDENIIQRAIETELSRGGQVFFVHNRVETIGKVAETVLKLVPHARVAIGHGQMKEGQLEKIMLDFYENRSNVLVCTTIIESGLDVPNANTLLVNRADMFGLAQLYQIRGRIGRGGQRAYAYLLVPPEGVLGSDAKKRLEVIQKFVELGSGFSIASHDLEIRGGGELLGPNQSGHIAAVGFDLYMELLDQAVQELRGIPFDDSSVMEPEIKVPFTALLSDIYIADLQQRLTLYRRLSSARDQDELVSLEEELADRFGALPNEARNLLGLIRIKLLLKERKISALSVGSEKISLSFNSESKIDHHKVLGLRASNPQRYQITPDSKFIALTPPSQLVSMRDLLFSLESLLNQIR